MVKKSIFTLILLAVIGYVSAQSLQFELNGQALVDGQTVYCPEFNEDFGEFIQEMQIRNISGTDLNGGVEKEEITGPEGSMNYFCWGLCFSPEVFVSPAVPMAAGSVSGEGVRHYSAEIEAIRFGAGDGRNLRLHVTDERLLAQTGGIVQGMSGCPILQNDKLVAAVTHVFVNQPDKGYGISIQDMLAAAQPAQELAA